MHENSGNSVIYYAHYTEGGVNKTGLTVTITVYEVIRDGTKTEVVTDGACTEIGDGLYRYLLASGTVDAAAEYVAVFHTATDTVDAQDIPAMWVIDRAGTEKLDTGVAVASIATDAITAAALKADAVTEIQSGLALEATLTAIKVKTDALDNSAVSFVTAVNGTTITVLRGDTLSAALTDIGALTDYVSIDFTVKQNYSQSDDEAIIRIRKNASGTDDGLLRFNGAAATANLGSIVIDDLASGDITITLAASCTDDLSTGNYVYDVQMITASAVDTLTYGKLTVSSDVTRAIA